MPAVVNRARTAFASAAWRIHASFTRSRLSFSSKILVVSSFGFWAVMLGLMPVLLFRVWLA